MTEQNKPQQKPKSTYQHDNKQNKARDGKKTFTGKKPVNKNTKGGKKPFKKYPPSPCLKSITPHITFSDYIKHPSTAEARLVLAYFGARFDIVNPTPLSTGIKQEMLKIAKEKGYPFTYMQINKALASYVRNPRYAENYRVGAFRVDLNGKKTVELTQDDINKANKEAKIRKTQTAKARIERLMKEQKKLAAAL